MSRVCLYLKQSCISNCMISDNNIAVLICTFNGSKFLRKQLDSIISQTYTSWEIFASDDGSTDDTLDILKEYQARLGKNKLHIIKGPGKGFAWNFLTLLQKCGGAYDYYAFSDQDDEWLSDKLERSLGKISSLEIDNTKVPALHCGRTMLVNEKDECIGYSPLFCKKPSFRNALIQSIAGGNTMLFNQAARNIINLTPHDFKIVSHDWWVYILISGCNGIILYDEVPTIKYRQHTNNIIGSNLGWRARLRRINGLFDGHFRDWIQCNLNALNAMPLQLSKESRWILENFIEARSSHLITRIIKFSKIKLYRQTSFGTIAFLIAVLFKKI